jgi:hypothetical protein
MDPVIEKIQALRHLAWLVLFSLLTVSVGNIVLLSVPQARETLFALDDGQGASTLRFVLFCAAYLYWAFTAWLCARLMLAREFPHDPTKGWSPLQREFAERVACWLPRALGLLASLPLAVAMFKLSAVYGAVLSALAALFLAFVVLRRRLPLVGDKPGESVTHLRGLKKMPPRARVVVVLLVATCWTVFFLLWWQPVAAARVIGSPALLLVALGGWTLTGSMLLSYWPNTRNWPTLNGFLPLLFVLGSLVDNHPVAPPRAETGSNDWRGARPALLAHYRDWMARHPPGEPVYLVALAGGASRAAYWSAMVLGQLEDHARHQVPRKRFAENVFLLSGISGGSLGGAAFVSALAARPQGPLTPMLDEWLGRDFLAPVVGAMLYPDLLQRFLPFVDALHPTDRSLALEAAWAQDWDAVAPTTHGLWSRPITALYADGARQLPALVLNTVRLEDGQRMLQSNLAFELPDAFDLLEPRFDTQHLTLAGAVHNSARFPYVSPAGRVRVLAAGQASGKGPVWGHLGDGGYHEGSGAATVADVTEQLIAAGLMQRAGDGSLRACPKPGAVAEACASRVVLVMLDNQPEAYGPRWQRTPQGQILEYDALRLAHGWPLREISDPPLGLTRAWSSNSVRAERRLAALAGKDAAAYVELRLPPCPAPRQPSMNWHLDDESRRLLKTAASAGCGGAAPANIADAGLRANLARLRAWIEGSEPVKYSGASERVAARVPIKAQSTAIARAMASICNAERRPDGRTSGRGGMLHRLSARP